ncbi:MAG: type II secretion system protein GspG [Myxococcota bacterium]
MKPYQMQQLSPQNRAASQSVLSRSVRGFSLIEIMVVLLLMGLAGGLVTTYVTRQLQQGRVRAATTQVRSFDSSIELYNLTHYKYPNNLQELLEKGILKEIPKDPWGKNYQYQVPGSVNKKGFDVYTINPSTDKKIGNWESSE